MKSVKCKLQEKNIEKYLVNSEKLYTFALAYEK